MTNDQRRAVGYALRTPCARCPFRSDVEPYLTFERAKEIAAGLRDHGVFHCHKTVDYDDQDEDSDEYVANGREQQCAGATILQENDGHLGQMPRIAERIGLYNRNLMNLDAPVPDSIDDWVRRYAPPVPTTTVDGEEVEFEHCDVVGPDCEDPAGYSIGGAVADNPDPPTCGPDDTCIECGSSMCSACRADDTTCVFCAEEDE